MDFLVKLEVLLRQNVMVLMVWTCEITSLFSNKIVIIYASWIAS